MQLESLTIRRRANYESNAGTFEGKVKFTQNGGEVQINLDEGFATKILALCAEGIVETTKKLATELTAHVVIGTSHQIEVKPEEAPAEVPF